MLVPFSSPIVRALSALQLAATCGLVGLFVALLAGVAPSAIGYESFVVTSADMQPMLHVGDLAVVQPVRAADLSSGDIISYRTPEEPDLLVTRRVVSMTLDDKGSPQIEVAARNAADPSRISLQPKATIGRLVYLVPSVGSVVTVANAWQGKALLIGLPLLLLGLERLRNRLRRRKQVPALISVGRRAMQAGHPELALRAAEGALDLDAYSRAAWILKQQAIRALETRLEHAST